MCTQSYVALTHFLHSLMTILFPQPSQLLTFPFDLAVVVCKILCGLLVLFCHTATLSQMWRMWNLSSIMTTLTPPRIISTALDALPEVKKRAQLIPSSPPTTWNKPVTWSLCFVRPTRPLTLSWSRWQRTEEVKSDTYSYINARMVFKEDAICILVNIRIHSSQVILFVY